jgi:hypothetical protein
MNVTCEAKVCRRVLFGGNSSNTPLEWSGHHQLSAEASLFPLPATQEQRYTDDQWGEVTITKYDACFPVLQ